VSVTFRTELEQGDGNTVGIAVPENVMAKLGPGKRYPVIVTIGDYSYRNTVGWYKGAFRIGVSAEHRAAAGVAGGDEVDVTLELDGAPREYEIPEELAASLRDAGVLEKFEALSFSKQRGFGEPWAAAKTQQTRDKNLEKIVAALG
jgi:hypothetical protein